MEGIVTPEHSDYAEVAHMWRALKAKRANQPPEPRRLASVKDVPSERRMDGLHTECSSARLDIALSEIAEVYVSLN